MPVVKSREYKSINRIGKKIDYIFSQKFEGDTDKQLERIAPFLFTLYNGNPEIENDDLEGISQDMNEQVSHINKRKDGTYYAENFINFSGKDFDLDNHDPEYVAKMKYTMADITQKWVELRGIRETTWIARPHFDTENAHIHILFSKNKRNQKKRVHLSKAEFLKAQNGLNDYQREYHPHLRHTFEQKIEPQKRQRQRQKDIQLLMEKHGRKPTIRQGLTEGAKSAMQSSQSLESVVIRIKKQGFEVYHRGGIPYGIINNGKSYRFTTLLKGTEYESDIKLFTEQARKNKSLTQSRKEAQVLLEKIERRKRSRKQKPRQRF